MSTKWRKVPFKVGDAVVLSREKLRDYATTRPRLVPNTVYHISYVDDASAGLCVRVAELPHVTARYHWTWFELSLGGGLLEDPATEGEAL